MDAQVLAVRHSKKIFLNSFLRDFASELSPTHTENKIELRLKRGVLELALRKNSILGLHDYEAILLDGEPVELEGLVDLITETFESAGATDFKARVLESQRTLKTIIQRNPELEITGYLDSEKKLLQGHPFHPWPKCKEGMSEAELEEFAPELGGALHLSWVHVPENRYAGNKPLDEYKKLVAPLAAFDGVEGKAGTYLVPFHPWQWQRIRELKAIEPSALALAGKGKNRFDVLSSMRSYFHPESPYLLKSSLNVRLTNSVRHILETEARRGQDIERILRGAKVRDRIPNFDFLPEPFYVSLKDDSGRTSSDCIVQFRENFKADVDLGQTFLLSSLVEIHPRGQTSLALRMMEAQKPRHQGNLRLVRKHWFGAFLKNVIDPLLDLALQEGILLGAHMQNLLVRTQAGLPAGVIYRDFQGSGLTRKGFNRYHGLTPELTKDDGNILSVEETNKVFGYYLIVNTVFNTIAMLARSERAIELELLTQFRNFIFTKNAASPHSFYHYLLAAPHLYQKGNMRCCLNGMNENTDRDPWSIYNKIPNPLAALRGIERPAGEVFRVRTKARKIMSLRVLEESDLDLFHSWHHKDFVSAFWELNLPKEELLTYMREVIRSPFQLPLIVELDGEPFAYFETYWAYEDRLAPYCDPHTHDRGLHLLIGEERYLRTRHVYDAMLFVTKYLFDSSPETRSVWGEPRADNKRIMRFCEKLPGWKFLREFDFPHKRALLLECKREDFFRELPHAL